MRQLLNIDNNAKTIKGQKLGFLTGVLYLAPADLSGHNVCPFASDGCKAACLNTAGRGGMKMAQDSRVRKTQDFFDKRAEFMNQLAKDIGTLKRKAARMKLQPVVRLNGTSDLPWEAYSVGEHANLFEAFPEVQFYDYTKVPKRAGLFAADKLPPNYHLTFSLAEDNDSAAGSALSLGVSVSVVFKGTLPVDYSVDGVSAPVVNGDEHDARFTERGVIVGLTAKGKAKKDTSGFVRS